MSLMRVASKVKLVDIEHDPMQTRLRAYHPDVMEIRKNYAKYHDAIKRMDQQVGDALAALEASGMADRTIVIYTSDHGGVLPRSSDIYITPDYVVHWLCVFRRGINLYGLWKPLGALWIDWLVLLICRRRGSHWQV